MSRESHEPEGATGHAEQTGQVCVLGRDASVNGSSRPINTRSWNGSEPVQWSDADGALIRGVLMHTSLGTFSGQSYARCARLNGELGLRDDKYRCLTHNEQTSLRWHEVLLDASAGPTTPPR